MRIYRTLLTITSVAGLWFGAGMILADDTALPTDAARRAKAEAFCKENPDQCEAFKKRRAEREAFCKENPETCEQQRAARKQRRAELKAKCEANPERCDELKQQARERWKARKAGGVTQPAPPSE